MTPNEIFALVVGLLLCLIFADELLKLTIAVCVVALTVALIAVILERL